MINTIFSSAVAIGLGMFLSMPVYAEDHANEHQQHSSDQHSQAHSAHKTTQHDQHQSSNKSSDKHPDKHAEIESLSPKLRDVLSKEMLALQEGMKAIIPAYISADWHEITTIAMQMKNSYIMKQKLTNEQMHELHSKLSPRFIEQDQEFHYLAGMLAHAAEKKKPELVGFYFAKLSESCVGCHARFATHKFPAFKKETSTEAHHH